ncbi:snaclec rhodocetin subunit delta-like isoform X2 [Callorhinchus milii]|uniref:snaclec rhodocetin subunit delta-like isoform X2 n=1 Tax=Callorhinchus milii TaxID=7868 RepID=UPI0004573F2D|nr:snaclec rhodocetin subunit delta-like isoform X2 [Callorhinchus milii]|eukprot:gi/632954894/ref/XP_007893206.1/ PREDICTED: rhodocetin subunit delta-like isoform X2 [Callorhinchus milii]
MSNVDPGNGEREMKWSLNEPNCPLTWSLFQESGMCFKYFSRLLGWLDSELACRASMNGSHLASIHSEDENNFVFYLIRRKTPYDINAWIGLQSMFMSDEINKFEWIDQSMVNYLNWGQFYKDIAGSCTRINPYGTWEVLFGDEELGHVCSVEAEY